MEQLFGIEIEKVTGCLLILAILIEKLIPNSITIKPKINLLLFILLNFLKILNPATIKL